MNALLLLWRIIFLNRGVFSSKDRTTSECCVAESNRIAECMWSVFDIVFVRFKCECVYIHCIQVFLVYYHIFVYKLMRGFWGKHWRVETLIVCLLVCV